MDYNQGLLTPVPDLAFFFFFSFGHAARLVRSQFPDQGSNPGPPAMEACCPNHWTTREFPEPELEDAILDIKPMHGGKRLLDLASGECILPTGAL